MNILHSIVNASEGRKKALVQFCEKHDSIWIYGAGCVGKKILDDLRTMGIAVEGMIVTDISKNPSLVEDKEVYSFSNIKIGESDGIIIGIAPWNSSEIIDRLFQEKIKPSNIYQQNLYDNYVYDKCEAIKNSVNKGYFSDYKQLDELGKNYGTDKSSSSLNYLNKYEFYLEKYKKQKKLVLIELGVYKGSSIEMWRVFFPEAFIIGADIDSDCLKYQNPEEEIKIEVGDLSDEKFLIRLGEYEPTIIIDDASHLWSHQIKALCNLFPYIKAGGIYILEDIVTSFSMYEEGRFNDLTVSTYEFLELVAEVVAGGEPLTGIDDKNSLRTIAEEVAKEIECISFIHGSCIMIKK